jgi:hypothetical protein
LADSGIAFARQVKIPVLYKPTAAGDTFNAHIVVARELIPQIKAVSTILPTHAVQPQTGPWCPCLTRPCPPAEFHAGPQLNSNMPRPADDLRPHAVQHPSNPAASAP